MAPIEFPLDVSGSTPPSSPSFPIVSSALTLLGRYEPRPPPPSERGPKPQAVQVNVVQHLPAKTMTPPPPPPPVQQQPVTLRWAALVGIVLIGMTYAFGYVIHGLAVSASPCPRSRVRLARVPVLTRDVCALVPSSRGRSASQGARVRDSGSTRRTATGSPRRRALGTRSGAWSSVHGRR